MININCCHLWLSISGSVQVGRCGHVGISTTDNNIIVTYLHNWPGLLIIINKCLFDLSTGSAKKKQISKCFINKYLLNWYSLINSKEQCLSWDRLDDKTKSCLLLKYETWITRLLLERADLVHLPMTFLTLLHFNVVSLLGHQLLSPFY